MDNLDSDILVIAVVPAYKVSRHIVGVVQNALQHCHHVVVVDDCCPQQSGKLVMDATLGDNVTVIFNQVNLGVGGAVMAGYAFAAKNLDATVIVKIDGDGQMDCSLIPEFVAPILRGEADYTKGNRFFDLRQLGQMPRIRIFGNAVLSLMAKLSTGYWDIFDPTNGYTAIHADVARRLPFDKISSRYFFETDVLFRLNTLRAAVVDVPMDAIYADEVSNLRIRKIAGEFLFKHLRNGIKRIFYNYYLRDMGVASFELVIGLFLIFFGAAFGGLHWLSSSRMSQPTPVGTIMITAVCAIWGMQLLLAFISADISNVPRRAIHRSRIRVPIS
jgi:glycosyltransferase involved in cell wall biosynthesis